jgi:hypothetical protein
VTVYLRMEHDLVCSLSNLSVGLAAAAWGLRLGLGLGLVLVSRGPHQVQ